MKMLIIGDIHIRANTPISRKDDIKDVLKDKFFKIRKLIEKEDVDFVLTTGDVLDRSFVGNETLLLAEELINSLKVPIYSICGNHDLKGNTINNYKESSISILERLCSSLIIPMSDSLNFGNIRIYFSHYGNDNFIIENKDDSKYNIIVAHSMIVDSYCMFEAIDVNSVNTNADLIITGHNHQKFYKNNVYNAGALLRLSSAKGDMDRKVEVGIFNSDTKQITQVELDIADYTEVFDVDTANKKQQILNESVIQELSDIISNVTSTSDIINIVISEEGLTDEEIRDVNSYLEVNN